MATPTSDLDFQNFFSTTLTSGISATDTSIPLDSVPNGNQGFLVIDPDSSANREVIFYTSKTGSTVECTSAADGRGQDDSSAVAHSSGVTVVCASVAGYFEALQSGDSIGVFPISTDRQDIAVNSTATNPHIQYGWTYVTGDATNLREAITVTFPVAYDSVPVVIAGSVGYRTGSNPSTIGDLTSVAGGLGDFGWLVSVHSITTTTCVLEINKHATAIPAATRLGLSWIAIGPKAR